MTTYQNSEKSHTASSPALGDEILDAAVRLAESGTWESLRLHQVAQELGIGLEDVRRHYRQKDDLVEAWYDKADRAMLTDAAQADYMNLNPRQRLHRSIMCWLDTLSVHRRISRDMLVYKFELGHIHLQIAGILRVSRTVQWMLESAHSESTHLQRVIEETTVTSIYLATFGFWMVDQSDRSKATREFLDNMLRRAETMAKLLLPADSHRENSTRRSTVEKPPADRNTPSGV